MEILETLAVALGFATLAGLNLYLVVFVTGLAINQGWVDISATYPDLMVLGDPAILAASGIFFCFEFFSDKIPWVDSLWDSVHTLIRPVGGSLLAIHTLGPSEPAFDVIIALLAGGTTLVAHGFKSGTRLALNATPEPVSNIAASFAEDAAVLGGLALMSVNPILAAIFCLTFLAISLYLTPKFFRRFKAFFWLIGHKAFSLVNRPDQKKLLYNSLTSSEDQLLGQILGGKADPEWSAHVLVARCKKMKGFVPMTFGRLIADSLTPGTLHFIGQSMWRDYHTALTLDGLEITQESRLFGEDITLYDLEGTRKLIFRLPSGHRDMANRIVESLIARRDAGKELPNDRTMLAEMRTALAGRSTEAANV
tara:strand:+ start:2963 stop:4060 length:1098 start_codon:yes stop_codon:yes gene_type:complete